MANISTEKIYLKTGTQFIRIIKYSKGKFYCELPTELCDDLLYIKKEDKIISDTTEENVKRIFKKKLDEWAEAKTNIHKVILFDSDFQGALASKTFKHKWEKGYTPSWRQHGISTDESLWEFNESGICSGSSLGMIIKWAVYSKEVFKNKRKYKYVSGRYIEEHTLNSEWNDNHGYVEIEWTPEREQFFLQLDESFARMIAKAYKALGNLTPEKLILLAESNIKLLN